MQTQLRDMEYFAAIAEYGQVQRAAAALGLTQPALSKSLRRLEQTMNTKLLKRTPKGVELTAVGTALLAQVRRLRLSFEEVTREISDLSEGKAGHLRIGAGPDLIGDLVPQACAILVKNAPGVTMSVTVGTGEVLLPALTRGEMDLAVTGILPTGHDDLVEEWLFEDEFVVYASAGHPLAKKKQVTLAELARERWATGNSSSLRQRLNQAFGERRLPMPRIIVETNAATFRLHLVPGTDLLCLGPRQFPPRSAVHPRLVELKVKGLSLRRNVSVFYRKDAHPSPAARRFIEMLKTRAKEIAQEPRFVSGVR